MAPERRRPPVNQGQQQEHNDAPAPVAYERVAPSGPFSGGFPFQAHEFNRFAGAAVADASRIGLQKK